jgi:lipopolysaccharide export system permease protein
MYTKQGERDGKTPEESYIGELLFPNDIAEQLHGKFIAEGHYRIVWPLFSIVLTLVAMAALFSGQFNRRGQWKRILAAAFISVMLVLFNLSIKGAAASSSFLAVFMYLNVILAIVVCLYIILSNRIINSFPFFNNISQIFLIFQRKKNKVTL